MASRLGFDRPVQVLIDGLLHNASEVIAKANPISYDFCGISNCVPTPSRHVEMLLRPLWNTDGMRYGPHRSSWAYLTHPIIGARVLLGEEADIVVQTVERFDLSFVGRLRYRRFYADDDGVVMTEWDILEKRLLDC